MPAPSILPVLNAAGLVDRDRRHHDLADPDRRPACCSSSGPRSCGSATRGGRSTSSRSSTTTERSPRAGTHVPRRAYQARASPAAAAARSSRRRRSSSARCRARRGCRRSRRPRPRSGGGSRRAPSRPRPARATSRGPAKTSSEVRWSATRLGVRVLAAPEREQEVALGDDARARALGVEHDGRADAALGHLRAAWRSVWPGPTVSTTCSSPPAPASAFTFRAR